MKTLTILKKSSLCLLFLISCNEEGKRNLTSSLRDSVKIDISQYRRLVEEYKDDPLTNDTILLGFRIGMPFNEAKKRITDLIEQNILIGNGESLFYLIPTDEWCSDDKDSVHQFVAKVSFSFDGNKLTRIYANLFAPRFYITSIRFRNSEDELAKKTAQQEYRKIVGDSFYYINQARSNDPSFYKEELQALFENQLLGLFKIKYGSLRHSLYPSEKSLEHQITYIWIDKGRLIKLSIDTGYNHIAKQYLSRNVSVSKEDFSYLIPIGSLLYSSIPSEINFSQSVDVISKEFGKQLDSLMRSSETNHEMQAKKRVEKIGI